VQEDSAVGGGALDQTFTLPSIDGSAGAAVALTSPTTMLGFWVTAEGGYGWTPSQHLLLSPHLDPRDQDKAAPLAFRTLALRGAFFRLAVAFTF